jgi:hypothetical protein
MTDETKRIFDAPYKVVETRNGYNVICTNKVLPQLCWTTDKKDANRLARLPELYDALMEAKNEMFIILNEWALGKSEVDYLASYRERKGKNNYEFFNEIQELLRKVRDGE